MKKIADIYRKKSVIVQNSLDTVEVGNVFVNELDKVGLKWLRNPSSGYFQIPLLDGKGTNNFKPDFVVWDEDVIYALDTKGSHLIIQDSEWKLFCIEKAYKEGPDLFVRLICFCKLLWRCHYSWCQRKQRW